MAGPTDWERRFIGIHREQGSSAPPAPPMSSIAYDDAPESPLELMRRAREERAHEAAMQKILEDEAEEAALRSLERDAKRARLIREMERMNNPNPGGSDTTMLMEFLRQMRESSADDRKLMLAQIETLRAGQSQEMAAKLDAIQHHLANGGNNSNLGQVPLDPIAAATQGIDMVAKFRSALDRAMPAPAAPAVASPDKLLEHTLLDRELRIREMQTQALVKNEEAAQQSLLQDLELKKHRIDKVVEFAEGSIGPILQQLVGDRVAGMVGGGGGGGNGNGNGNGHLPGPGQQQLIQGPPADNAPMMDWACPECSHSNFAPLGTPYGECANCHGRFELRMPGQQQQQPPQAEPMGAPVLPPPPMQQLAPPPVPADPSHELPPGYGPVILP